MATFNNFKFSDINLKNQIIKLDNKFHNYYKNYESFKENEFAIEYLTPNRMDIIIKIIFLEYLLGINKTNFNRKLLYILYKKQKKHTTYSHYNQFREFENEFLTLISDYYKKDINENFLVPIDKDNEVIDSGNRFALSLILKKKINIIRFLCNANYFNLSELNKYFNLKKNILITDYIINNYVKYNKYLRIILLFPCRKQKYEKETLNIIRSKGKILIRKKLKINTLVNAYYIVKNLYFGANWIGNLTDNYKGALWKAEACFKGTNGELDVLLFYPKEKKYSEASELKIMKEEIRKYHKVHYHSIHSSDNQIETKRYSKIFFHDESSRMLANKKNNFFLRFEKVLEIFSKEKIKEDNFAFSGSMPLAAIGIRAPNDIDIIHEKDFNFDSDIFKESPFREFGGIHSHNIHINQYLPNYEISELIYNPKYFFYYMGFKFIHPKLILKFKINRLRTNHKNKDLKDINEIKSFFNSFKSN